MATRGPASRYNSRVRSLKEWWRVGSQPMSARAHLIFLAWWLILIGLEVYRVVTKERDPGTNAIFLLAAVSNLIYLGLSYRNARRAKDHEFGDAKAEEGCDE